MKYLNFRGVLGKYHFKRKFYIILIATLGLMAIAFFSLSVNAYDVKESYERQMKQNAKEVGYVECFAAETDGNEAILKWKKNPKADKYVIYAAKEKDGKYKKIDETEKRYSTKLYDEGELVYFKIKAVEGKKEGYLTDPISLKVGTDENAKEIDSFSVPKTVELGESAVCTADVEAFSDDIRWTVSDNTIASVDENGILHPKETGTLTVYATAHNGLTKGEDVIIRETTTVPDFTGYTEEDAMKMAFESKLTTIISQKKITASELKEKYKTKVFGQVQTQSIKAGEKVETNSVVDLTIFALKKEDKKKVTNLGGDYAWPLENNFYITSVFGPRWGRNHDGIDIGAPSGVNIMSSRPGTVELARWYFGYGNCVIVDHGDGYKTLYGHMSKIASEVGDKVKTGTTIGYVGSTGNSTGPHLHFEVIKDGTAVDPIPYLYGDDKEIKKIVAKEALHEGRSDSTAQPKKQEAPKKETKKKTKKKTEEMKMDASAPSTDSAEKDSKDKEKSKEKSKDKSKDKSSDKKDKTKEESKEEPKEESKDTSKERALDKPKETTEKPVEKESVKENTSELKKES